MMRWRPSNNVMGTSVASTELWRNTSRSSLNRVGRPSEGTMRSSVRRLTASLGAWPSTRRPSTDIARLRSSRIQSKEPMRARSWARASLALLLASSMRVREARSR